VRYTPFLDSIGATVKEDPDVDQLVNIIDSALGWISGTINWGSHEGRRRKPCHGQPLLLTGQPIGQYHCEFCGEMQLAATAHLPPDAFYEKMTGEPWPAGYEGE
jgi:hypothetical protein